MQNSIDKVNKLVNNLTKKDKVNLSYEFINNVFRCFEGEFRSYIINELCKEDTRIKQDIGKIYAYNLKKEGVKI